MTRFPIVEELKPAPDAFDVAKRLAGLPHLLFLDSALQRPELGRYSFVAADPACFIEKPVGEPSPLASIDKSLNGFTSEPLPDLPPFQGGVAGLFSYDLARSFETIPATRYDEFQAPAMALGIYDVVVAFDHLNRRSWIISQGFPEKEPAARLVRANERLKYFRDKLQCNENVQTPRHFAAANEIAASDLAPQFEVAGFDGLTSNMSSQAYRSGVQKVIDYIWAGDAFQVNLAHRLLYPATDHSLALYARLRERNPATFAGYFDLGEFQICSASPERFFRCWNRQVETRPIKGTRERMSRPEADLFAGDDLTQSEKDRAENVMIVDLLRNDLSRVCRANSVIVEQLCKLEVYEYVQHLVSAVRGELREDCTPLDLLAASFPGGSITGAPKVRAMEIIAELEPTARGAYCGSLGYLGFDGAMDLSILIRTITAGRGWLQLQVGGGITAESSPGKEYQETRDKARGLVRSLR